MHLTTKQSYALLEKHDRYVTEVCDKCGRIPGPVACKCNQYKSRGVSVWARTGDGSGKQGWFDATQRLPSLIRMVAAAV